MNPSAVNVALTFDITMQRSAFTLTLKWLFFKANSYQKGQIKLK